MRQARRAQASRGVQEGGGAGQRDGRGCAGTGRGRAEERGDDTVRDGVELGDGCPYGGRKVSVFFLVPLGPDAAQTVEGHHSHEQVLRRRVGRETSPTRHGKQL